MATSGTTTFNPDIITLAEEAFERAGLELRSGYDLKTARRSIDFLMSEWANRGINLWKVDNGTVSLSASTATYNLPTDTIDLIEYLVRSGSGTTQQDYNIRRISVSQYASITNKNTEGRPSIVYIDRAVTTPTITLWPVPEDSTYTFVYYRLARIEDTGTPGDNTMDVPYRFLPALAAGLAFQVAMKRPESADRVMALREEYEKQFRLAYEEDRDRASARFVPYVV